MKRVLLTHADEPIGRQVLKTLYHDPEVECLMALGEGPPPRALDRFLAGAPPRVRYTRLDLAKHRPVSDLFHSGELRSEAIDTVVHVPRHATPVGQRSPLVSGVAERTAETRLVLQHALETASVKSLVAVGSAFVYRLPPGNANRLHEDSDLDLDPDVSPEIRSWIDCDMLLHGEVGTERLRVVLLRVPTVVAAGGYVYLNPSLSGRPGLRLRALGYDPLCALVADKDVALAVRAALHSPQAGVYNVAGDEAVPLSVLSRWTRRPGLPLPSPALGWLASTARLLGREGLRSAVTGEHLRFGFTLDTRRAARQLAFRPSRRIGLARAGDGSLRLETAPA